MNTACSEQNSVTGCCELENETTVTIVATGYNDQIINPCEIVGFKKSPLLTMQFDNYFKLIQFVVVYINLQSFLGWVYVIGTGCGSVPWADNLDEFPVTFLYCTLYTDNINNLL